MNYLFSEEGTQFWMAYLFRSIEIAVPLFKDQADPERRLCSTY
ncbi:hypothetical protein HAPAU_30430 [Halalkalicoccus paucihalophilus]|uniref:Uncharacterized protein n=1 Tax=Halalkalicoccus paucihalophilus TaxID=1008153 RepID=A0A151AB92_9EURY|nr:hypothetical protein HAPAU_30430 [Halalkalicoccus paucihalophilus]